MAEQYRVVKGITIDPTVDAEVEIRYEPGELVAASDFHPDVFASLLELDALDLVPKAKAAGKAS